ncbi:MAG: DUF805 domain-containing protein [Candidatus Marinimicrobia bacterium]|nr:DUF805 domain-containing protein [Candidatus Neomarinimicrobiota bacterium]
MNWYLQALKSYAVFSGRARRREYFIFVLFNMIFSFIAIILDNMFGIAIESVGYGPISGLYLLAIIIPSLAVTVRRLHDVGKSGWMVLIPLIPLVGVIWLLILLITDSDSEENQYGSNPKDIQTDNFTEDDGDTLILIAVIWMFISRTFFAIIPKIVDGFYQTATFEIINIFSVFIWALIPISLAFVVKNKSKQIILFILGGLYFLYGFYEAMTQFIK